MNTPTSPDPPASPCVGVCQVNDRQICVGCHRSLEEIGRWSIASSDEKRSILELVQSRRANATTGMAPTGNQLSPGGKTQSSLSSAPDSLS
ncbi:DUF1289 domain-containing protein [Rhodopirellula halodulae]|uniref:DUF1289 domain-containing protein n=1 Tax=Rhodopirellula halodulae TaxID=2894198 RepID=UPI001E431184|nr:DUF1289 domain-containing protein [Rhodopirellula sp. JC737]MCC9657846.1 DUF1289 domain-containing protein [Rhodopirellula sp. JC737]